MEPEPPSLLRRIRWGNVAWALAAVVAVGLVLAWPHLQRRGPGLPDETASVAREPASPAVQAPQPAPVQAARPAPRSTPKSAVRPTPRAPRRPPRSTRRRRGPTPSPRPARHRRHRAAGAQPVPVAAPSDGSDPSTQRDSGPAAPAGDQEFLPG